MSSWTMRWRSWPRSRRACRPCRRTRWPLPAEGELGAIPGKAQGAVPGGEECRRRQGALGGHGLDHGGPGGGTAGLVGLLDVLVAGTAGPGGLATGGGHQGEVHPLHPAVAGVKESMEAWPPPRVPPAPDELLAIMRSGPTRARAARWIVGSAPPGAGGGGIGPCRLLHCTSSSP